MMMPSPNSPIQTRLIAAADELRIAMNELDFVAPVTHIYNPLDYAWDLHQQYLRLVADRAEVLFLGMNPGPWGMAQTGVPFGEVSVVRDWFEISGDVGGVDPEHPKRPIEGLSCARSEVSGRRLWGLMRDRFGRPEAFFEKHFVVNYCPLVFMEITGRNRTPDKLPADERGAIQHHCDEHLRKVLAAASWKHLVGVGAFAETCLKRVADSISGDAQVSRILHPSPASPAANRDWAGSATTQLQAAGIWS